MKNSRWMLNRVGLVNFWYYDEEEFEFLDGRMLLRGSNGSGKSVTMQSFIPLLLDGNMRPERLDPFGSRARKMDNYLLEEDDAREERIGYLYMELRRGEAEQYVTLGIGMRARRYKKLEPWYFCITDGRRIGKDFFLYRDVKEKIPFSKMELRNRIADGGRVMDTQREYMEQVNRLLFGFETLDEYREMLELLIQLRTPKLSKDFKPSVINDILSNSLQTLSEDDLRPLSEAIENMDNIKANMQQLQSGIKAAAAIDRVFSVYNRRVLYEKAAGYLQVKKEWESLEKKRKEAEKTCWQTEEEGRKERENHESLRREYDLLEEEKRSLEMNDAFRLKQEEQSLSEEKERLGKVLETKQKQQEKKKDLERELSEKGRKQEETNEGYQGQIEEYLSEMEEYLEGIPFDSGTFLIRELQEAAGGEAGEEIAFSVYDKEYMEYLKRVEAGIQILQREKLETERYDERLLELEECRQRRSEAQREQVQYENLLHEAGAELLEEFYRWNEANRFLKLSEKTMGEISVQVEAYRFGKDYSQVKEIIRQKSGEARDAVQEEIREKKDELLPKQRDYHELEGEFKRWQEMKDPEPDRSPAVVRHREKLAEMGISFYPLYQTIDFADSLTDRQMGILEEALLHMGLLDALIIPAEDKEKILALAEEDGVCDRYLFGDAEHIRKNLTELLEVDNRENDIMFYQAVSGALSGIGMGSPEMSGQLEGTERFEEAISTWIDEQGRYGLGVLEGTITGEYQPKLIGQAARERYRKEQMENLQEQMRMLSEEIQTLEKEIEEKEQKIAGIKEEEKGIPSESGLVSVGKDLADAEHRLENIQKEVLRKEEAVSEKRKALEQIRLQVQEICQKTYLTIRLDVFEDAKENLQEYGRASRQVEKIYGQYRNGLSMVRAYAEQREEVLADLDDILYELGQTEQQRRKVEERLSAVLKQLQMSDYQQIRERLEHCVIRMNELPELREKSVQRITQLENDVKQSKDQLAKMVEQILFLEKKTEQMGQVFAKELALGYVVLSGFEGVASGNLSGQQDTGSPGGGIEKADQMQTSDSVGMMEKNQDADSEGAKGKKRSADFIEKMDVSKIAAKVVREIEGQLAAQTVEELHGKVQEVFHENKGYLSEYRMMVQTIFGELKESCDAVSERITRLDIRAKYRGISVSFPELLGKLKADAEIQERLLSDKDKELFEDILAGIISKKIRAKIHASKRWVKNMNRLMESMQTSSGLCLSLKWKSKKADKEDQLDTQNLVELLEQDVEIMQEEDIEKLSMHFRSKIAEARQRMDGDGNTQSFHVIMKEILDYRAWFEFCLECQKTGEKKREMTDRVFFTFSGGEKAMSMYVPLFSAVVAKYSGAREDAPRLISLDEAFAGVDEMNIKDMFRLMVELEFNFMINSQILWGDYETVPALAIYQLIRPQNAKFVSVIAYTWNGKVRELVC